MLRSSVILLFIVIVAFSCERIQSYDNLKLLFSEDTIHFDTVFTTIGPTTMELRVINSGNTEG